MYCLKSCQEVIVYTKEGKVNRYVPSIVKGKDK